MNEEIRVGKVSSYFGGVYIKSEDDGTKWWGLESYSGIIWEQIPYDLFYSLLTFSKQTDNQKE